MDLVNVAEHLCLCIREALAVSLCLRCSTGFVSNPRRLEYSTSQDSRKYKFEVSNCNNIIDHWFEARPSRPGTNLVFRVRPCQPKKWRDSYCTYVRIIQKRRKCLQVFPWCSTGGTE